MLLQVQEWVKEAGSDISLSEWHAAAKRLAVPLRRLPPSYDAARVLATTVTDVMAYQVAELSVSVADAVP